MNISTTDSNVYKKAVKDRVNLTLKRLQLKEIKKSILIHIKMRQMRLPLDIGTKGDSTLLIEAKFTDTSLTFKSTSLKVMKEEAIHFIEEMNERYKTNNKHFKTKLPF